VHGDSALNYNIRVLLCAVVSFKLAVKSVAEHFDFCTARKLSLNRTVLRATHSAGIVLALDVVFICSDELSNHIPQ